MYWSDIACPFCYIGSTRVKRALKALGYDKDTKLEFKSFQLDPTLPKKTDKTMEENFAEGHGMTKQQADLQMRAIKRMGEQDGLNVDIAGAIPTNSFDAHRLIKLAASKGDHDLFEKLIDRLYKLYFTDHESIADHAALTKAAVEVGLNKDEVQDVLNSNKYADEVKKDIIEAVQSGVQGVPFFVINHKYAISGAQPYKVFVNALKKIHDEEVSA